MITNQKLIWSNIHDFPLDDPSATLSFTQRLAHENNWDRKFAERVVLEYKKFIFLCAVSPEPVTPSDAVDQAWHLHITYTESYWNGLCRDTIGKQLHHHPTKGGTEEREKFYNLYEQTLVLYQRLFYEAPPADIWPPSAKRFADIDYVRVNRKEHLVLKRPDMLAVGIVTAVLSVVVTSLFTTNWAYFMMIIIGVFIIMGIAYALMRYRGSLSGGCGGGCAYDSGGDNGCGGGCGGCGGCGD